MFSDFGLIPVLALVLLCGFNLGLVFGGSAGESGGGRLRGVAEFGAERDPELLHRRQRVGVGPSRLRALRLRAESGHQRVVAVADGVHRRALHRHLPSDEGAERLHGAARQKDHRRRLGFRHVLYGAVARPHQNGAARVHRPGTAGTLRLQAVAPGVPRLLSGRPDRLLPGAADALVRPLRPHRPRPLHQPHQQVSRALQARQSVRRPYQEFSSSGRTLSWFPFSGLFHSHHPKKTGWAQRKPLSFPFISNKYRQQNNPRKIDKTRDTIINTGPKVKVSRSHIPKYPKYFSKFSKRKIIGFTENRCWFSLSECLNGEKKTKSGLWEHSVI